MKQFEKNPGYRIDYRKVSLLMDARIVRENAKQESQEMMELENRKIQEKRDMFMSREHEKKKKMMIVGWKAKKMK